MKTTWPELEFRLLVEGAATEAGEPGPVALSVPAGVSFVEAPGAGGDQATIEKGNPGPAVTAAVLEAVASTDRPTLLLEVPSGMRARVNGSPAGRLEVLEVGDVVHLESSRPMHVTLYQRDPVGPAGEAHAGRTCPVCRTRFRADQRICVCGRCGWALHLEEGRPEDGALECARLVSRCPHCDTPLRFEAGYVFEPGA